MARKKIRPLLATEAGRYEYRRALITIATESPCEVRHAGTALGTTCYDKVLEARDPKARYGAEWRLKVSSGETMCTPCRHRIIALRALGRRYK